VIGSQAISTRSVDRPAVCAGRSWVAVMSASPTLAVAGQQVGALLAPLRLLVGGMEGDVAQAAHDGAVHDRRAGGHPRPGRLVHERHELVREAGHGAGDADATHVRAAAHPVDPTPLRYVALDHRTPAAQFHQTLRRAVLVGEVALL